MKASELVVTRGGVRQAGATQPDTAFIEGFRRQCERSLYAFATGVLGYDFLVPHLHRHVCAWLQRVPPRRKMLLMPREHGKSTLVPRALPLHSWVQPREANIYLPGVLGVDTRWLLAGETFDRAKGNLRVCKAHLESNELLRALWPHVVWELPRRDAKVWNDTEFVLPRSQEFAEPSLLAVGVGAAITGIHPDGQIKDDITTEAAANSDVVMQTAIDWHINTRALSPRGLEIITATYWAAHDLPHVVERDPTVAVNSRFRAILDDEGHQIWPEGGFDIEDLKRTFGPRFYLLYMNSVTDSALVDFRPQDLRTFTLEADGLLHYTDDPRDATWLADPTIALAPRPERPQPDWHIDPRERLEVGARAARLFTARHATLRP
jgi:hypothetical protein